MLRTPDRAFPPLVTILLALAVSVAPAAADTGLSWVKVDAQNRAQLPSLGLDPAADLEEGRVFDYGGFLWIGLEAGQLNALDRAGLAANAPADFTFDLGGKRFDPLAAEPSALFGSGWSTRMSSQNDLRLVQTLGPMRSGWLESLSSQGLKPIQYIHPYGYIAWGSADALSRLGGDRFVRWTGDFLPAYRLLPQYRGLGSEAIRVDVLIYRGAGADEVVSELGRLGATEVDVATIDHRFVVAALTMPGDQLSELAAVPGVYTVQPEPTDGGLRSEMSGQINVNNHDATNLAFPGYQAWLASVGLSGAGVRMANVDGGILETHPDLVNRFTHTCVGTTCGGSQTDSHGTHTAGIMAADGASGITNSTGFLRGLGVAPGANLVEQVYFPFFTQPGGMLLLIRDSWANDAVLSSNSWGPAGSPRGYDNDTLQVDIGVRDADDNAAGNQQFTYVLSFMNGGGGTSTQGSPDEAKNLFNIGSTKMQQPTGTQLLAINDLSANTAHGPALDGRTIPHMVAPGCSVDSTVLGNGYGFQCGTSMASPQVSGAVGLFFEYYRGLFSTDPTPALVKAAFLPVAHSLAGNRDADGGTLSHPFDSKQGWGRMDLEAVVDPALEVAYVDDPNLFDASGESWSQTFDVDDTNEPVRLMLVWTDAPGHGTGGSTPAWNNDLDLVVEAGAQTFRGNNFGANGFSVTGGTADGINNTEGVFIESPTAQITVRVEASNINSDGVPGVGDGTDQDFSLVCYNCRGGASEIFLDGFEAGNLSAWSSSVVD